MEGLCACHAQAPVVDRWIDLRSPSLAQYSNERQILVYVRHDAKFLRVVSFDAEIYSL